MFKVPVVIGLSPNLFKEDVKYAFQMLFRPKSWKHGNYIYQVEKWFKDKYKMEYGISFKSGRSALYAILKSLNLHQSDEILTQAFTCVAIPNSIIWANLKPVFVDIDETLNIDIKDAETKITSKTKAMIVQHTFGVPANIKQIVEFCKLHKLILIEDCAHALGATINNQLVGTFGDAAFFSFGRDKIISSVFGGLAITNNKQIGTKITQFQQNLSYPRKSWIIQQLLHPIITTICLKLYNVFSLGKILLFISQKLNLLSLPVENIEKKGIQPKNILEKFPNALAYLALKQLYKLELLNNKRLEFANFYFQHLSAKFVMPQKISGAIYLRFNLLLKNADKLREKAKKKGLVLGNWYSQIIDPKDTVLAKVNYSLGSCPKAEIAARTSLNLSTNPNLNQKDIKNIVNFLEAV